MEYAPNLLAVVAQLFEPTPAACQKTPHRATFPRLPAWGRDGSVTGKFAGRCLFYGAPAREAVVETPVREMAPNGRPAIPSFQFRRGVRPSFEEVSLMAGSGSQVTEARTLHNAGGVPNALGRLTIWARSAPNVAPLLPVWIASAAVTTSPWHMPPPNGPYVDPAQIAFPTEKQIALSSGR